MMKILKKSSIGIVILFALMLMSQPAQASWPPFNFKLFPESEDGKITYTFRLHSNVDWLLTNVIIKIPLPEGTRYVDTTTIPSVETEFDGEEVTFLIPVLYDEIDKGHVSFEVEVVDPDADVLVTQPWISWEGTQPGDYLSDEVFIDSTRNTLNWEEAPSFRLELEVMADVDENGVLVYQLYPRNVNRARRIRMQDVKIKTPLPEGVTFLSTEAPSIFSADFDGKEVTFSTLELTWRENVEPLKIFASVDGLTEPTTMHSWATWKNSHRKVGKQIAAQEEVRVSDIVIQPKIPQRIVADMVTDVPFSNYDLTSVALATDEAAVKVFFYYTNIEWFLSDDTLVYGFFIDRDCDRTTGSKAGDTQVGIEYWAKFKTGRNYGNIRQWDATQKKWSLVENIRVDNYDGGQTVVMWIPYDVFEEKKQFCWTVEVRNRTLASKYNLSPLSDTDQVPDRRLFEFRRYQIDPKPGVAAPEVLFEKPKNKGNFINTGDIWRYMPASEPAQNWNTVDFDDSDWFSGPTSIGYGRGNHTTDISRMPQPLAEIDTQTLTTRLITETGVVLAVPATAIDANPVYMRHTFSVADPASLSGLALDVKFRGGFVAYLNGVEVARHRPDIIKNASIELSTEQKAMQRETFSLNDYIDDLAPGVNLLAIEAHPLPDNSSLSITPKLSWAIDPTRTLDALPVSTSSSSVENLSITDISGKLAVPIDNREGAYDIYIFSMPDGEEIYEIPYGRQPDFRFDGSRLLVNREGSGAEDIYEYNLKDDSTRQVSEAPRDSHPFYDPDGNRVVYGNDESVLSGNPVLEFENGQPKRHNKTNRLIYKGVPRPFIFVQCSLKPPHEEVETRCREVSTQGILVPAGQMGDLQGTHPVWTINDMITYRGCNSWAGFAKCGIYTVSSGSTKGLSDGFIPRQLTDHSDDTPSDTEGNLVAFTSRRDGDWEAYIMDVNGKNQQNISNSPGSNDGLPTISPDGNWVAFVSDREGSWAIWVAPVQGGPAEKLFDIPSTNPWADDDRTWLNERISWGP